VATLGIVSAILFSICFLPQIARTYRTKNVEGLSPSLLILVFVGYLTGLGYVLKLRDNIMIVTYGIGLILSGIVLAGYFRFRRR